jgi:isopentenyl diphosphate isomerase/L-lactate dehydrogenase-like FMN-dependent dehydrogenase
VEKPEDEVPGEAAQTHRNWPVGIEEWEQRASSALTSDAFDWIAGGAGEEATIRANRAAFDRRELRPRMLIDTSSRDISVEISGTRSSAPFWLAPIGGQTVAHPQGEKASARAARELGIPLVISTAASYSMEEIAAECGESSFWYQLYWVGDRGVVASFVRRAEDCGARAIVLTVDSPMVGWRDRDLRTGYTPFIRDEGLRQYTSDPVFRSRLEMTPEDDPRTASAAMMKMFPNVSLTWNHLEWLRNKTSLPVFVKGLLRGEDARRALDAGMDGVIVSNHGGRQLDGEMASLDALPEVRRAVGDGALVLFDSGIRRGVDVVKALALGANAVLVGRPYIYGLATGGQEGVEQVLRTLMAEIDLTFVLVGVNKVSDLDPSFVV